MKLYVGKKVKLKNNLKGTCKGVGLTESMKKFASRHTRIIEIEGKYLWLAIDNGWHVWEDDALDINEKGWD